MNIVTTRLQQSIIFNLIATYNKHFTIRDDANIISIKIVQFWKPHTPLVHLRPQFLHLFDLGRPNLNEPPPLEMITNQLKENIIQGLLLNVIRSFLRVGFRFQYQLINLVWLSYNFFSFSWSLIICFFVGLYSCVFGYPKILPNVFYLYIFLKYF